MKKYYVVKEGCYEKVFASEEEAKKEFNKLSFEYLLKHVQDKPEFDEFHWDSVNSFTVVAYDFIRDVRINVSLREEISII